VRGYFKQLFHPVTGPAVYPGLPWHMHDTPGALTRHAPGLGEHTAEVLAEIGHSDGDLAVLGGAGVLS
jgi:crotonobetainyl-CoA:carnitine CoA-transferase CaiB-like acyl-CoA transferase